MKFVVEYHPQDMEAPIHVTVEAPEFGALLWNGQWGVEEFAHAEKGWSKVMLSRALAALELHGVRGRMTICGDVIEFVAFGARDRIFLFPACAQGGAA
jgi:hypothetical protein